MKTFNISITETLSTVVGIEAENEQEALYLAERAWKNGDHILDSGDFQDVDFAVEAIV